MVNVGGKPSCRLPRKNIAHDAIARTCINLAVGVVQHRGELDKRRIGLAHIAGSLERLQGDRAIAGIINNDAQIETGQAVCDCLERMVSEDIKLAAEGKIQMCRRIMLARRWQRREQNPLCFDQLWTVAVEDRHLIQASGQRSDSLRLNKFLNGWGLNGWGLSRNLSQKRQREKHKHELDLSQHGLLG